MAEALKALRLHLRFARKKGWGTRMDEPSGGNKKLWGALVGGLVTVVTLVVGVIAIIGYYDQNPGDINGTWIVQTLTETTSLSRYKGMSLKYDVQFVQNGNIFKGTGEKTEEQEAGQPPHDLEEKARTPIEITGTVTRSAIDAAFKEQGTERESHGEFHWKLKDGSGEGTFFSTAANSTGSTSLKRP
jgi:hypothetical protein